MPRSSVPSRLAQPTASSSRSTSAQPTGPRSPIATPALQPHPPSPLILKLRQDYRWASISQFLWTFGDGLGLTSTNWDIDALEQDLDSPEEDKLVPKILVKLLYALTYDRTVNRLTLETHLRTQYLLRSPRSNPFGSLFSHPHEPRPWAELGLGEKVSALYDLSEWQLADPGKFRALLKNEGEMDSVAWRIQPCGWDKDENTYWLFDDNRLWVQHPLPPEPKPPKPPRTTVSHKKGKSKSKGKGRVAPSTPVDALAPKKSHKRKERPAPPSPEFVPADVDEEMDIDTARAILNEDLGLRSAARRSTRTADTSLLARAKAALDPETPVGRRTRTQANHGTPAPLTVVASSSSRTRSRAEQMVETPSKRPRTGMRGSYRLRGAEREEEEVWQEIPEEWLSPEGPSTTNQGGSLRAAGKPNGRASRVTGKATARSVDVVAEEGQDSDSELSDLSDESAAWTKRQASVDRLEGPNETAVVTSHQAHTSEFAGSEAGLRNEQTPPLATEQTSEAGRTSEKAEDMDVDETSPAAELTGGEGQPKEPKEEELAADPIPEVKGDSMILEPGETDEAEPGEEVKGKAELKPEDTTVDKIMAEEPKTALDSTQLDIDLPKAEEAEPADEPDMPVEEEYPESEIDANDWVRLESRKAKKRDFLEWEAVCVDRWDWENFPLRFKGSKHVDEKAFYAHLTENLCPGIIVALREKEIEVAKQEAIRNRKRSSRILMRELEREEQQAADDSRREMEVRMQRVRNDERRKAAEEEDKAAKERERDERLREREERLKQREEAIYEKALAEAKAKEQLELDRKRRAARREAGMIQVDSDDNDDQAGPPVNGKKRKAEAMEEPTEEDWELACEICHQAGWNIDDDKPIVACETCGRWQHQACHDSRDDAQGRVRRNWDKVDFFCADCRRRKARERERPESRNGANGHASPVHPAVVVKTPTPGKLAQLSFQHTNGLHPERPKVSSNGQGARQAETTPQPDQQHGSGIHLGLENMRILMSYLPSVTIPYIHIAGTNGKGSVSAMLDSCLRQAGQRTGRFNSPHLVSIRDSILLNGLDCSEAEYKGRRSQIDQVISTHSLTASEFEITTATAFTIFATQSPALDVLIVECGMGGQRDATNILPKASQLCSVLTMVDLDHQGFLGNTVEEIANDKCGIMAQGRTMIVGQQRHQSLHKVIQQRAKDLHADYVHAGWNGASQGKWNASGSLQDHDIGSASGSLVRPGPTAINEITLQGPHIGLVHLREPMPVPLHGEHQNDNTALAVAVLVTLLSPKRSGPTLPNLRLDPDVIREGLGRTEWRGRCSWVPLRLHAGAIQLKVLVDGAHNAAAATQLRVYIETCCAVSPLPITYIIGLSHSPPKTPKQILQPLLKAGDRVAIVPFTTPVEGMPWIKAVARAEVEAAAFGCGIREMDFAPDTVQTLEDGLAWATADRSGGEDALVVVTGSLYLVADVYRLQGQLIQP